MNSLDYAIALVFSLLIVGLGMLFSRNAKSMSSFFAGGGSVPWWVSGLSLFMSFFSVGTFVVWGAIAYTDGFVSIAIQTTMAISGIIIGLIIAPAWNKTKVMTVAEFISDRLGVNFQKLYSSLFLFINLFTAGAFLYPVGKIIEVSTGIPLNISILILGICIIAYTSVGGLWAVLVTDVLQFVVLSAAVIIIIPLSLAEVGGLNGFLTNIPEGFTAIQNDKYTWVFLFAFLIYNTVFIGGNWAYVQRYTSVSSPSNAKKVGWLFASLYMIAPLIWMIPPMVYRIINPDLTGNESEEAYLLISKEVAPAGLLGLILASMVFATASSVNTTLNIAAGVFTNDLLKSLTSYVTPQRSMKIARLSTLLFGIIALLIAMSVQNMGGIVAVVLSMAAVTGAPLYLPPIWALFSKRQTGWSILLTTLICLCVNLFFKFLAPSMLGVSLSQAHEMLLGAFLPIVMLCVFEVYFYLFRNQIKHSKILTISSQNEPICENIEPSNESSLYGVKIIMYGIFIIGGILVGLGLSSEKAVQETVIVGLLISVPSSIYLLKLSFFAEKSFNNS